MKTNNTKQQGSATVFFYPQKGKFIGVCLELDIVDDDPSLEALRDRMLERVISYVRYVVSKNKNEQLLDRPAPDEYWDRFNKFLQLLHRHSTAQHTTFRANSLDKYAVETIPLQRTAV